MKITIEQLFYGQSEKKSKCHWFSTTLYKINDTYYGLKLLGNSKREVDRRTIIIITNDGTIFLDK